MSVEVDVLQNMFVYLPATKYDILACATALVGYGFRFYCTV